MKRTVFTFLTLIASIIILLIYMWTYFFPVTDDKLTSTYGLYMLAMIVVAYVAVHFLRCREWCMVPFVGLLNAMILFFAFSVFYYYPVILLVVAGALVYSSVYVTWIAKSSERRVLPTLIVFWILVLAVTWILPFAFYIVKFGFGVVDMAPQAG